MKRIIIVVCVLFIGMVSMAYLYFSNLKKSNGIDQLSLLAVTANSPLVFSFDNDKSFYEILSKQSLFDELLGETKAKQLTSIREKLLKHADLVQASEGQKIYISFLPGPNDEVDFLIATQFKESLDLQQLLKAILSKKNDLIVEQKSNKITFSDSSVVYIGIKDKLAIISSSRQTIQKVEADKNTKLSDFGNYIKENQHVNKNTLASLYLDFNRMNVLLKHILKTNIDGELNLFNQKNGFAVLSYNFSKDKLLFNGNLNIHNAINYYGLFADLPAQKISINAILPKSTANYTAFVIADYEKWFKGLRNQFDEKKETEKIDQHIAKVNQKYGLDLAKVFPKYFKNQLITFQLKSGEKLGAIALSNGDKVEQLLLDLSADYAPNIKIFKEAKIPYSYFGEPFKKFDRPFYTIIDNYLVMANYASTIDVFLSNYRNDALLINDAGYQNFTDQLTTATISFYVNHTNSNELFGRNLKLPYFEQYQTKITKFDVFSCQLSGDNGKFLSNLLLYKYAQPINNRDSLSN